MTPVLDPWNLGASPFELPVYHSWRFRTGTLGNFEHAARLIKPVVLPATAGRRDMDVSDLDFDLGDAASGSLPAEGALMSVAAFEAGPPAWPASERDPFVTSLSALLNKPSAFADPAEDPMGDPELVPQLYGQWYAARDELTTPLPGGTNPVWFHELNSDPRNRVAGALGTKVIQREQQALLASGWNQVSEIRTVNDALRVLQLTRGLLESVYSRHLTSQSAERFYQVTRTLHDWVTCDGATICGEMKASRIRDLADGLPPRILGDARPASSAEASGRGRPPCSRCAVAGAHRRGAASSMTEPRRGGAVISAGSWGAQCSAAGPWARREHVVRRGGQPPRRPSRFEDPPKPKALPSCDGTAEFNASNSPREHPSWRDPCSATSASHSSRRRAKSSHR
jgi:hypothetical protein